jgi:hypothetical protein
MEVRGVDETIAMLDGVKERIDDLTPAMEIAALKIKETAARCFAQRVAPDGTPWAPLAESTIKKRKPNGALERSVFADANEKGVKFGASADYASYQNETRPFLPESVDEETTKKIAAFIASGE